MKCDIVFSIKRTRPVLSTSIESAVLALAYTRLQYQDKVVVDGGVCGVGGRIVPRRFFQC